MSTENWTTSKQRLKGTPMDIRMLSDPTHTKSVKQCLNDEDAKVLVIIAISPSPRNPTVLSADLEICLYDFTGSLGLNPTVLELHRLRSVILFY